MSCPRGLESRRGIVDCRGAEGLRGGRGQDPAGSSSYSTTATATGGDVRSRRLRSAAVASHVRLLLGPRMMGRHETYDSYDDQASRRGRRKLPTGAAPEFDSTSKVPCVNYGYSD